MKRHCVLMLIVVMCFASQGTSARMSLWYDEPAKDWQKEALPIGSGSLGAMIFGDAAKEHIQFNEDTLWIGDEQDTGAYQTFGDLYVDLGHKNPEGYRRELDISRAIHRIRYKSNGVTYTRRYFASHPAGVLVFHFTADQKGAYTGIVSLVDAHKAHVTGKKNRIQATGTLEGYVYKGGSNSAKEDLSCDIVLAYESQLAVLNKGGSIKAENGKIALSEVDSFTIILGAGTDYLNQRAKAWKGPHPHERISSQIEAASTKPFRVLLSDHVRDYRSLFDRLVLDIGQSPDATSKLPTDERLTLYKAKKPDPDLEEMLFQYARYLMISSSRKGSMPANLQGVWNQSNRPPWRCDYHTDVNIQMNYWFVDQANLSDCFGPLAEWFNSIRAVRKDETKAAFNTRGWITHAENGIFGGSTWKWSKGDAAWVAQNLWDHYAYTLDKDYLRTRAYPIMKELCAFWQDNLKTLDNGTLVSPDGFSPEHGPHEDGVSFDQQLVWDLFTNTIEASEALGVDETLREKLTSMKDRLHGPKIGKWGQLQEWMVDRDDPKDKHRHLSHLIAVHPGRQISPLTTPKFAAAAKVSMNARGDGATGWSKAWKINIWARLHDGDRAYKLLSEQIRGNYYNNLFGFHPPFQIDGNFGYASGLCEMLVQSHMGMIHLMPAVPSIWASGQVKGLQARGGYELDIAWDGGRLTEVVLRGESNDAAPCTIMYGDKIQTMTVSEGGSVTLGASLEPVKKDK
jgi:alpha-L-fucosidase 2